MSEELITATQLAEALAGPTPPVVLDVRWTIAGGPDHNGYLAGHLPGAVFVDLNADLAGPAGSGGRHPLPDAHELEEVWRRVGLNGNDAVVVYDNADSSAAVRAWWLLRWSGVADVRVLDGGLEQWVTAEVGPTAGVDEPGAASRGTDASVRTLATGEPPAPERGAFTIQPGGMPTVDIDGAATLAQRPEGTLLDARAAARYRGEVEPIDPVAGHIPGATNLPYASLYRADGTLRPADELRTAFEVAGVVPGRPVAASCGSGVTACHLVLAGRVAGLDLALYPGSYSQWCALGRVVATGDR